LVSVLLEVFLGGFNYLIGGRAAERTGLVRELRALLEQKIITNQNFILGCARCGVSTNFHFSIMGLLPAFFYRISRMVKGCLSGLVGS